MPNIQQIKKPHILGSLPKAVFSNLGIGVLTLIAGAIAGGPKIAMSQKESQIVFFILAAIYLFITLWSILSLAPKRRSGELQTQGIYKFVRHPMYSAIIFILNPALGILLRSWLLLLATFISYFIWRWAIDEEEKEVEGQFGEQYLKYRKITWPFFPNLFIFNKPLFFGVTALAVFFTSFIALNFQSFYLRAVEWELTKPAEVSLKRTSSQNGIDSLTERPRQKFNKANSIVIDKLNIDAPLVFASGTSQKELNSALDQGVLIYPGSKSPGETGELFLSGHSSSYPWDKTQYGQVFTLIDRLQAGDIVTVYFNQYKYDYQISGQKIVVPSDATLNAQTSIKTITLMTCWPIGTAWKRLMVQGVLME